MTLVKQALHPQVIIVLFNQFNCPNTNAACLNAKSVINVVVNTITITTTSTTTTIIALTAATITFIITTNWVTNLIQRIPICT